MPTFNVNDPNWKDKSFKYFRNNLAKDLLIKKYFPEFMGEVFLGVGIALLVGGFVLLVQGYDINNHNLIESGIAIIIGGFLSYTIGALLKAYVKVNEAFYKANKDTKSLFDEFLNLLYELLQKTKEENNHKLNK